MMSNTFSSRDQHNETVSLSMATNLWEMIKIVYLSHDLTAFHAYFSNLGARFYFTILSWSLSIIFTSEFLCKNSFTTTFRTKMFGNMDFSIHFGTINTTARISTYWVQYWFESTGMFIYYIWQIYVRVVQRLLGNEKMIRQTYH